MNALLFSFLTMSYIFTILCFEIHIFKYKTMNFKIKYISLIITTSIFVIINHLELIFHSYSIPIILLKITFLVLFSHFFLNGHIIQKILLTVIITASMRIILICCMSPNFTIIVNSFGSIKQIPTAMKYIFNNFHNTLDICNMIYYYFSQKDYIHFYFLICSEIMLILNGVAVSLISKRFKVEASIKLFFSAALLFIQIIACFSISLSIYLPYALFEVLLISTIYLIITLLIFKMLFHRSKEMILELENISLLESYKIYENNKNEIINMYENARILRHDMKNIFLNISILLKNNRYKELESYIGKINDSLHFEDRSIRTGNEILDGIINAKTTIAKMRNISCICVISKKEPPIESELLSLLIANLMDNAIEAAEKSAQKKIWLNIQPYLNYYQILISNSVDEPVLLTNADLNTSKQNSEMHGFGLKSIKKIVEETNSLFDYYDKKDRFVTRVMIPYTEEK